MTTLTTRQVEDLRVMSCGNLTEMLGSDHDRADMSRRFCGGVSGTTWWSSTPKGVELRDWPDGLDGPPRDLIPWPALKQARASLPPLIRHLIDAIPAHHQALARERYDLTDWNTTREGICSDPARRDELFEESVTTLRAMSEIAEAALAHLADTAERGPLEQGTLW